jgi:hypothetical protein
MKCPVCLNQMKFAFTAKVLGKHPADYDVCDTCGFLRAREPYWLDEAYSRAIAAADTGLVMRNFTLASKIAGALYWCMGDHGAGQYLDTAGGYGMLTRLMRDIGFNFYWADKYCENLLAPRFDYKVELGASHAVTAIEVLEHLTDPAAFVEETLAAAGSQTLIFTTELYIGSPPHPDAWWYYTFGTGQHIGFFQRRTLEILGARLGLKLVSANGLHVLSKKPISERTLALATGRLAMRISPWWIRRRLGSKTMSDHQLMLQGNVTHNSAHQ